MLGRIGGKMRGLRRQERKLERLQQRLEKAQTSGNAQKIERLQHKIARTQQKLERRVTGIPGLTMPMVSSAMQQQGIVAAPTLVVSKLPPHPPGTTPPANWNEAAYLARHSDVADAVRKGVLPSGLWHYLKSGQNEGRALSGLEILKEPSTWMWGGIAAAAIAIVYGYVKS